MTEFAYPSFLRDYTLEARHDYGPFAGADLRARICEAWRFPVVDSFTGDLPLDDAYWEDLTFGIIAPPGAHWRRAVDTSLASPDDILDPGAEPPVGGDTYVAPARSVVVLVRDAPG